MEKELKEFSSKHGVDVDWCVGCQCFTVYCSECGNNECGGQHVYGCLSIEHSQRMQDNLNNMVDNWGKAK